MSDDDEMNVAACNCSAIRRAARAVTLHYDRHLEPSGLRVTQFAILARLDKLGPSSINVLADDLEIDRTTLGRTIRPLESGGLIGIAIDPDDRRSRRLTVTASGRDRLVGARERWRIAQSTFEDALGGKRSRKMRQVMAAVADLERVTLSTPA